MRKRARGSGGRGAQQVCGDTCSVAKQPSMIEWAALQNTVHVHVNTVHVHSHSVPHTLVTATRAGYESHTLAHGGGGGPEGEREEARDRMVSYQGRI